MPNHKEGDRKEYPIRLSDEFIEGLSQVWSPRVLDHIRSVISLLPTTSELGSADVRPSLVRRYGNDLRKLVVSTFVIIYRFDGNTVDALAIVRGPQVV